MNYFFKVRYFNFKDFFRNVIRYWRSPRYILADSCLLLSYFLKSPYTIAKEFEEAPYGETPLSELEKMVRFACVTKEDIVYEMGAGRGRGCFWLSEKIGCRVVGIEHNPVFVQRAICIARWFSYTNIQFRCEDMLLAKCADATLLYLYGTCLTDEEIIQFVKNCKALRPGTKILTISYSLEEYDKEHKIELIGVIKVTFPWGQTDAYLHQIRNCAIIS
jgi:hypothetical protein